MNSPIEGALDYQFLQGNKAWAYGALRTHGGTHAGKIIKHTVLKQGW